METIRGVSSQWARSMQPRHSFAIANGNIIPGACLNGSPKFFGDTASCRGRLRNLRLWKPCGEVAPSKAFLRNPFFRGFFFLEGNLRNGYNNTNRNLFIKP